MALVATCWPITSAQRVEYGPGWWSKFKRISKLEPAKQLDAKLDEGYVLVLSQGRTGAARSTVLHYDSSLSGFINTAENFERCSLENLSFGFIIIVKPAVEFAI